MPRHQEVRNLPYTPHQMFDLVADVGRYGEFLPWVVATRIRSKTDRELVADMIVGFKMIRETFTSRVLLERPHHLHVDYLDGPLKYLKNDWRFEADGQGGTDVHFCVDFEFRQKLFERLAGTFFHEAFRRMVAAFERRAADVYGAPSPAEAAPPGNKSSSAQRTA
ncbi:MAG: type II toxin-antitoxin system RatA family toxin [Pseudomonadota bacterium]